MKPALARFGTPRTTLLAGVAASAVLALAVVLAGAGSSVRLLDADPGLLQPLPGVHVQGAQRLGPLSGYPGVTDRPLFSSDRRPHPFFLDGHPGAGEGDRANFDYILTGVLSTPTFQMAIVQPAGGGKSIRVRLGDSSDAVPGWKLVELGARSAVFVGPRGRKVVDLRTYDGGGALPGTAVPARAPGFAAMGAADLRGSKEADAPSASSATPRNATESELQTIRRRIAARRSRILEETPDARTSNRHQQATPSRSGSRL